MNKTQLISVVAGFLVLAGITAFVIRDQGQSWEDLRAIVNPQTDMDKCVIDLVIKSLNKTECEIGEDLEASAKLCLSSSPQLQMEFMFGLMGCQMGAMPEGVPDAIEPKATKI